MKCKQSRIMESNNITKILNELGSGPVAEANFGFRK